MNKTYHLKRVQVGETAQRPGLAHLSSVLRLNPADKVHALSRMVINGVFYCDRTAKQLLRSAEEFRGAGWYDSVVYEPMADSDQRCVGEVRAVIPSEAGDLAVIMEMAPVDTDEGSVSTDWRKADSSVCAGSSGTPRRTARCVSCPSSESCGSCMWCPTLRIWPRGGDLVCCPLPVTGHCQTGWRCATG